MAEIPPTLNYRRPERGRVPHVGTLGVTLLIIAVVALVLSIIIPSLRRPRERANEVKCASNLRQIGYGIVLYAQANRGAFPTDLPTLAGAPSSALLGLGIFTCFSSADTKAASLPQLSQPGHCSYIYVGAGLTYRSSSQCILALEDPANHATEGGNALYADGHVEFLPFPQLIQTLNDLAAGHNPPTSQAALSQTAALAAYHTIWQSRMAQLKTGAWRIPATRPTLLPE